MSEGNLNLTVQTLGVFTAVIFSYKLTCRY